MHKILQMYYECKQNCCVLWQYRILTVYSVCFCTSGWNQCTHSSTTTYVLFHGLQGLLPWRYELLWKTGTVSYTTLVNLGPCAYYSVAECLMHIYGGVECKRVLSASE